MITEQIKQDAKELCSREDEFCYMMLDRLRGDCNYFLDMVCEV